MKKSVKTIKIYRLKDYKIDDIVNKYLFLHKTGRFKPLEYDKPLKVRYEEGEELPKLLNKGSDVRKSKTLLADKFTFLIHSIIKRLIRYEKATLISLHSSALQYILGEDYNKLIKTLWNMNLLDIIEDYEKGVKTMLYGFYTNVDFTYTEENPRYLKKYFEKYNEWFEKYKIEKDCQGMKLIGDTLYKRYNQSLSMLKLKYEDECYEFLSRKHFPSERSKEYYYNIVEEYQTKTPYIKSIDNNKRIYSILTSTPRIIKPFLNLKFICDIHNSHPLLFNSIIFDFYDIPLVASILLSEIFYELSDMDINDINFHHLRDLYCNALLSKGLENSKIAEIKKIPLDIFHYVFLTTTGRFWDEVISDDNDEMDLTRAEIKVKLFAEVFYSKSLTTPFWKKYARIFRDKFPSVYKIVLAQKKENPTQLANDMMKLESMLFQEILTKLYNKRYKVVSIHDALAIIDCKANDLLLPDEVKRMIIEVYKNKVGLYPNVSVDYYGEDAIKALFS